MPAATTKDGLLKATEREWERLQTLVSAFDEKTAEDLNAEGFCAKRIIGHRAAWIDMFLAWCAQADAGNSPAIPAKGFKWTQLPALNARIWDSQRGWSWRETCQTLGEEHARLLRSLRAATDGDLYAAPLAPGLKWTRGRYAEASGPSHYRSAAKALRSMMPARVSS